ncbi:MAG: FecR domain-containing protein [Bacteroidia bacterium]|nr:FecR domain-containing protein [Bacteroidia bacterium]
MKNYQNFTVNEFAMDEYFQSWVFHPDENSNAFWKSWSLKTPHKVSDLEEARDILNNFALPHHTLSQENVSGLWTKIQQSNTSKPTLRKPRITLWYWAAAAVLVMGITAWLWMSDQNNFEYRTQFGETKTILLPDSSTVILNSNSRLTYAKNWHQLASREIWLEGEAYFSVVHKQDDQTFKVFTSGGIAVEVLGTTFNVYHRAVETKVVLNSGQITLSFPVDKKEKKILMKPGEMVEFKEDKYSKRIVDPTIYAAWTENKIILNQTSLLELVQMAKDNYGIDLEVTSEKMLSQTVSGSMPIANAENFVNQVAMAFQLKAVQENGKFFLKEY